MENKNKNNFNLLKSTETLYTCHKCIKTPKIMKIDYINDTIELKCEDHQITKLKIKEYLNEISKLRKCKRCFKESINADHPLKYCSTCNVLLCNNCAMEHIDSRHILFNKDEYNIKCKKHLNNFYETYCNNCKGNICKECKKSGIHLKHNKFDYIEIQPCKNDFDIIDNFNKNLEKQINELDYAKYMESLDKEQNERISIISSDYEKCKKEIYDKYKSIYQQYINKITKEKRAELSALEQKINAFKNDIIKEIHQRKLDYEKNRAQIEKNKDIIALNNLIINSYKKQGEYNLNYIENIKTAIEDIKLYIEQNQQKDKKENKNDFNLSEEIRKYGLNMDSQLKCIKGKNNEINNELMNNIFKNNKLELVNISSKSLSSLNFLKNNSENLKYLLLVDCPISDINILSNINLNSLIEFKIANAKINVINALMGYNLNNIKVLNLSNNQIKDINILQKVNFANILEELYLNNNQIKDISVFKNNIFPKLKILFLSFNIIEDISPIKSILINSCQTLSLEKNQIHDISLFKEINKFIYLKDLSIKHNLIDINNENNKNIFKAIIDKKINFQY